MDFSFLDYIWRGLTVGTLSSLTVLSGLLLTTLFINKKATRQQMKYFFHTQVVSVLFVFIFSFTWVACVDPELASGCFSAFAKDQSFFTLTRLFSVVWLVGFSGLLLGDLFRIWQFSRNQDLVDTQDQGLLKQFNSLVAQLQISSFVKLRVSDSCASPYAEGLLNHQVVLPSSILRLNEQSLKHIMAHELIHVRDKDSMWKFLELLARRILFFNPLMYLLAQRHLLAIEMAADEQAVAATRALPKDYVNTLIEVVSLHRMLTGSPLALNASRTFKETKERMEALVLNQQQKPKKTFVNSMIFGSVLLSIGFSVAQARSTVQESAQRNLETEMMCSQVHHEKMIESWLRIEVEKNKCEE